MAESWQPLLPRGDPSRAATRRLGGTTWRLAETSLEPTSCSANLRHQARGSAVLWAAPGPLSHVQVEPASLCSASLLLFAAHFASPSAKPGSSAVVLMCEFLWRAA